MNAAKGFQEKINKTLIFESKLTLLIGSIHGMYFLVAPGNQDLDQSVFICAHPLL